jgi:hypothetical protein
VANKHSIFPMKKKVATPVRLKRWYAWDALAERENASGK